MVRHRVGKVSAGASLLLCAVALLAAAPDRSQRMVESLRKDVAAFPALAADPYLIRALAGIAQIPPEDFVSRQVAPSAYLGASLEIGWRQTISDPYILALMTAAVNKMRGTGK